MIPREFPERVKIRDVADRRASRSRPCPRCQRALRRRRGDHAPRSSTSSTSWATRRACARRACAATGPTCSASWSPTSSRSAPSCSRAPRRGDQGTGYELVVYSAGGARQPIRSAGSGATLARLSGTLIDGAVLVTPTVVDVHSASGGRGRPPHRPLGPADRRLGQPATAPGWPPSTCSSLGHRRIGFIGGRPDLESARLREPGFREADGGSRAPRRPRPGPGRRLRRGRAADAARELLDRRTSRRPPSSPPTTSPRSRPWRSRRELGLRVPEDLSVIGFDNIPESALATPALTTVEQPIQRWVSGRSTC